MRYFHRFKNPTGLLSFYGVLPDILVSKKILNPWLISELRIEAQHTSPLRKKKNKKTILGRNELSQGFHDQDVPHSRERKYSNISFFPLKADIDMNNSRPKNYIESGFFR